jgi:hypothetical protein
MGDRCPRVSPWAIFAFSLRESLSVASPRGLISKNEWMGSGTTEVVP